MLTRSLLILCLLNFSATIWAQETQSDKQASRDDIADLIGGLDDDKFKIREESERSLLRLGPLAADALRTAAAKATGERKARLERILRELTRSIRLVEKVVSKGLDHTSCVTISEDGQFLYSTAWKQGNIGIYRIDKASGKLTEQAMLSGRTIGGALSFRISPGRPLAVATCYQSQSVVLFKRDIASGKIGVADVYQGDAKSPTPVFPVDSVFSHDGRFLFVADASIRFGKSFGGVLIFRVNNQQKLSWINTCVDSSGNLANVRGIALHPSKNEFYCAASTAGTLSRCQYDLDTGLVEIKQTLKDGQDGIEGLAGAMSATCSSDGKFVYTSSGRFDGDSSIGVYEFNDDGDLEVIQELISGREDLGQFLGGNELVVSADGLNLYASGTRSSTLAGFARNPESGKLSFIETVPLGNKELGPAGVAISPDGTNLYVAVEQENAIAIFQRD